MHTHTTVRRESTHGGQQNIQQRERCQRERGDVRVGCRSSWRGGKKEKEQEKKETKKKEVKNTPSYKVEVQRSLAVWSWHDVKISEHDASTGFSGSAFTRHSTMQVWAPAFGLELSHSGQMKQTGFPPRSTGSGTTEGTDGSAW